VPGGSSPVAPCTASPAIGFFEHAAQLRVHNCPWVIATNQDLTWSGPSGLSFAANLTPDTQTGLRSGVWTEELFIKALRTGKHIGTARDILPPMPWPDFAQLTDDDLKAIWAYLGTIPPIQNQVPDPIPPTADQQSRQREITNQRVQTER
jgi:hypothetical protein